MGETNKDKVNVESSNGTEEISFEFDKMGFWEGLSNKVRHGSENYPYEQIALELMAKHNEFYGELNKVEDEYALRGAVLSCTHGNRYIRLDMCQDHGVYSKEIPVMTCNDYKIDENIFSFGLCGNSEYEPVYSETAPPPAETGVDKDGNVRHICCPILLEKWGFGIGGKRFNNEGGLYIHESDMPSDCLTEMHHGDEQGGEYVEALSTRDNLICLYGGVITIEENPETEEEIDEENQEFECEEEDMLVTMKQLSAYKFSITDEGLKELNQLLKDYNITDKGSIALFLATCTHESAKGTKLLEEGDETYFIAHGYTSKTRGAGYLHITKDDQVKFYRDVLKREPPEDPAQDIADNYAWWSAVWEWGECAKGAGVIMNNYVEKNGSGENVFLITQYFINSYLKKEQYPYFDSDLGFIRAGGEYVCNFDTEELEVRGRSYRLPNNYDDRKSKYDEAIKIFMQEVE